MEGTYGYVPEDDVRNLTRFTPETRPIDESAGRQEAPHDAVPQGDVAKIYDVVPRTHDGNEPPNHSRDSLKLIYAPSTCRMWSPLALPVLLDSPRDLGPSNFALFRRFWPS